jgi:hypothetical protein
MKKDQSAGRLFLKVTFLIIGLLCLASAGAPPLPAIPNATFTITAYGAVGDGVTDNTADIQATIDAAKKAGGGTVIFPAAAKPYECGPITFYGSINYQIDSGATLQCISYSRYPLSGSAYVNFISAKKADNIEISGKGTIDGQGADWWAEFDTNSSMPHRPYLIKLDNCDTVYVHDVTLSNSPMFHLVIIGSDVTVDGITISAPSDAPNTDGIDPAGTNYLIENCSIATGDDNIALKPGNAACKDFTISNCIFGTGHGLSIGGQTNYGLDSLTVSHCVFKGTTNGIRFKANRTNGGLVQNLLYSDITMDSVEYPVFITSYYEETFSTTDPAKAVTSTTPIWENITIRNLVSTNSTQDAITIQGLPEMPVHDITFAYAAFSGSPNDNFSIAHAHGVNFFNTTYNGVDTGLTTSPLDATISQLTITTQPQSQKVALGSTLKLAVVATADFTPVYQWFYNNTPLVNNSVASGVNTAALTLTNFQAAQAGSYTVSLGDSAGDILSDSAIVVMNGTSAVILKTPAQQSRSLLTPNNQSTEYIDLAGHVIRGKNAAGTLGNNFYLIRDMSGKWAPYIHTGN